LNHMDELQNLITQVEFLRRPRTEKNIFSIGGHGHYENPISDIMAFFIDPKEVHGFGAFFLSSLIECAGLKELITPELIVPPRREAFTESGKRIDLLLEGEHWVIVVENKIRHSLNNPFHDYSTYISKLYPHKRKYYILLSAKKESPPENWVNVNYTDLIDQLKKNINLYKIDNVNNKWYICLKEYILNMQEQIHKQQIDPARFNFIKENYSDIQEIIDMFHEYIEYIKSLVVNALSTDFAGIKPIRQHTWRSMGIALRIYLSHWQKETNITLLLKKEGGLSIRIYVYDVEENDLDLLKKYIDLEKYKEYWTESAGTIKCFGHYDSDDLNDILNEIRTVTKRLNSFYQALNSSSADLADRST